MARKGYDANAQARKDWATDKPAHPSAHYQSLNFNGFRWSGFWDGLHHFWKQLAVGGYVMTLGEEQLTNGDAEFMSEHGLSL